MFHTIENLQVKKEISYTNPETKHYISFPLTPHQIPDVT